MTLCNILFYLENDRADVFTIQTEKQGNNVVRKQDWGQHQTNAVLNVHIPRNQKAVLHRFFVEFDLIRNLGHCVISLYINIQCCQGFPVDSILSHFFNFLCHLKYLEQTSPPVIQTSCINNEALPTFPSNACCTDYRYSMAIPDSIYIKFLIFAILFHFMNAAYVHRIAHLLQILMYSISDMLPQIICHK